MASPAAAGRATLEEVGERGTARGISAQPAARGKTTEYHIPPSNIGYKLLKKAGWRENTGLGATQQGHLRPLEPALQINKRGLGAKEVGEAFGAQGIPEAAQQQKKKGSNDYVHEERPLSKKARKKLRQAERNQEQALAQALYREFYPDNL